MRSHNKDKFLEGEETAVHPDVQAGVRKLYLYLKKRTPTERGGTLTGTLPRREMAQAAYIWKAFKKQLFELRADNQKTLTRANMIPRLKDLIQEVESGQAPGSKAEAEDSMESSRKGVQAHHAGSGSKAPVRASDSDEEMDEEDLEDLEDDGTDAVEEPTVDQPHSKLAQSKQLCHERFMYVG